MAPPQWAYQVENYVNEPDEELICSVCRAVFCDPVMCPCDHVFCRACITKWLQNNRNCPICRKRASHSSIKQIVPIIKNLIMKLVLNCHNKTLGCKMQFSLENSESHVKECEYEFVQCKNKPCKDRLFRKDIVEHETSDCPHRYIKCKTCGSKMPTSAQPEKHDCVRALQLRLRRKNNIIRKKNNRIKELRNEIKSLKTPSEGSAQPRPSALSSLSPGEIMINIADFDSLSSSSVSYSDDSSESSIIIFANSPLSHSDDNAESESFSNFMDNNDSIEYSRNESPRETSEYRNAESQTSVDLSLNDQQNDSRDRHGNSSVENDSVAVEVPDSVFGEERSQSRRPVKRRPTTQKPAKRRFRPVLISSDDEEEDDDDDESKRSPPQSSKQCWRVPSFETAGAAENNGDNNSNAYMAAGPSSSAVTVAGSTSSGSDKSSNTNWQFWSRTKSNQNRGKEVARHAGEVVRDSNSAVPLRNAVFERTLTLLQQYNLESDPEWLPEFASHRGNDTTTDSDSSYEPEITADSSTSENSNSNSDSNNEDNIEDSGRALETMHWMLNNSSDEDDDDPDWDPIKYLQNKAASLKR